MTSPAERPAETRTVYPNAPPIVPETGLSPDQMSRRRFLGLMKNAGIAAAVGAIGLREFKAASDLLTNNRWPANESTVKLVGDSAHQVSGRGLWLYFGGFGEQYNVVPAEDFYERAVFGRQAVAAVNYANQGIAPDGLGDVVHDAIVAYKPSHINIVGRSMGTAIAMMVFKSIFDKISAESGRAGVSIPAERNVIPPVNILAAISSPADMQDAYNGEIAAKYAEFVTATGYQTGYAEEVVFNTFRDAINPSKAAQVTNLMQWLQSTRTEAIDSWDGPSPQMCESQISNFLVPYKIGTQYDSFKPVFGSNLEMFYLTPTNPDLVVDESRAIDTFRYVSERVPYKRFSVLPYGPYGHADAYQAEPVLAAALMFNNRP